MIKYALGVLDAARLPLVRLQSVRGFHLQCRYETHAEDEIVVSRDPLDLSHEDTALNIERRLETR